MTDLQAMANDIQAARPFPTVEPTDVAVCVCTFRRNGPLRRLLEQVATTTDPALRVGVALIDDSPEAEAKVVADEFSERFPLGVHYRNTASRNISIARNTALQTGMEIAPLLAMVDDDTMPVPNWLGELVHIQQTTQADAVTGRGEFVAAQGAPRWISEQPFLIETRTGVDGEEPEYGSTQNTMFTADWVRNNPTQRFSNSLGRLGGEDMVFFYTARAAGLRHRYSWFGKVSEEVPLSRCTYRFQTRQSLWLGNSECVTNLVSQRASKPRLLLRGTKRLGMAFAHPVQQLVARKPPQLRYTGCAILHATGLLLGVAGVKLNHH